MYFIKFHRKFSCTNQKLRLIFVPSKKVSQQQAFLTSLLLSPRNKRSKVEKLLGFCLSVVNLMETRKSQKHSQNGNATMPAERGLLRFSAELRCAAKRDGQQSRRVVEEGDE